MTLGRLFEPERRATFVSPSDFLCCQYYLNILHQGIYTYYREHHAMWRLGGIAFLDLRGCKYGHGGFNTGPAAILRFARDPSYVPDAQPIEIARKQLKQYMQYFFFDYVPSVYRCEFLQLQPAGACHAGLASPIDPRELLRRLSDDPDCLELRTFASA
jgi:hypothetical protein